MTINALAQETVCGDAFHSPTSHAILSGDIQWPTFNFLYGTVEVRAKIPAGTTWPAIWLLGHNCQASDPNSADNVAPCSWPDAGSDEIDIAEFKADTTTVWQNSIGPYATYTCTPSLTDASVNWHVYTFTWTSNSLTWKIDGTTTCSYTGSNVPSQAMFLKLNVAQNSNTPSGYPQSMIVDYVQVTQP
jgi:beta-glucanase (GH16 family)